MKCRKGRICDVVDIESSLLCSSLSEGLRGIYMHKDEDHIVHTGAYGREE
jgi:hypothetical protein